MLYFLAQDRCLQGVCMCTQPKLTCFKRDMCPCYSDDAEEQLGMEECCIYAIDCIIIMGAEKDTESKSCFIGPDDSNLEVRCHDLVVICKVLEDYFCSSFCPTR